MKRILLSLLLAAIALPLSGQTPWSLERCVEYALQHNIGIREGDLQAAVRQADYLEKKLAHLPVIGLRLVQDFNWGRSVDIQELVITRDRLTKATAASLEGSVTLFNGLARHHERLAAGKAAQQARLEVQAMREALSIDVTRAYLQLMLSRQIHAYTRESYAAVVRQRERTASLVEAGSQPKSALNELEAQVASERASMVEAACRVRTATLDLTGLMNLPVDSLLITEDTLSNADVVRRVPILTDTQLDDYLFRNPRVLGAQASVEGMRHRNSAAVSAFLPTLTLSAGYGTYYSSAAAGPLKSQFDENRNPSLTLQLGIPVFSAGSALSGIRQGRLALQRAELEAEKVRTQVTREVLSATIEAENCLQQYLSAEETLQAMQDLLRVTEAKYNLGAASALDYVVARNHCAKAMSDYLQSKWQYVFQLKLLAIYRP